MRILLIFILVMVLNIQPITANEMSKMNGLELRACSIALDSFLKEITKADLSKYTVHVEELMDSYKVIFTPIHEAERLTARGGETNFGKEVHYEVSKKHFEIIHKSYAR